MSNDIQKYYSIKMLEGSLSLRKRLPYGVLKKITEAFGRSSAEHVSKVISGEKKGNLLFIECAMKIADAYERSEFEQSLEQILEEYKNKIKKV